MAHCMMHVAIRRDLHGPLAAGALLSAGNEKREDESADGCGGENRAQLETLGSPM